MIIRIDNEEIARDFSRHWKKLALFLVWCAFLVIGQWLLTARDVTLADLFFRLACIIPSAALGIIIYYIFIGRIYFSDN